MRPRPVFRPLTSALRSLLPAPRMYAIIRLTAKRDATLASMGSGRRLTQVTQVSARYCVSECVTQTIEIDRLNAPDTGDTGHIASHHVCARRVHERAYAHVRGFIYTCVTCVREIKTSEIMALSDTLADTVKIRNCVRPENVNGFIGLCDTPLEMGCF